MSRRTITPIPKRTLSFVDDSSRLISRQRLEEGEVKRSMYNLVSV